MKEHLLHYFPFLKKEFRPIKENELQSELVFIELFPNEDIELWKLKAIVAYQKGDIKKFEVDGKAVKIKQESVKKNTNSREV